MGIYLGDTTIVNGGGGGGINPTLLIRCCCNGKTVDMSQYDMFLLTLQYGGTSRFLTSSIIFKSDMCLHNTNPTVIPLGCSCIQLCGCDITCMKIHGGGCLYSIYGLS